MFLFSIGYVCSLMTVEMFTTIFVEAEYRKAGCILMLLGNVVKYLNPLKAM